MPSHPMFTLQGTALERGIQYGSATAEIIKKNISFYKGMFEAHGVSWKQAKKLSKQFIPFIKDYLPDGIEEMKGVAKGAKVEFEDILTLNCRSEVLFAKPDGCTTFGVLPELTADGHTYLGENWDWLKPATEGSVVLNIICEGRPTQLICAEAGIIGGKGLNSAGVGICLNALSIGKGNVGVPLHILYRSVLNQTSISNALDQVAEPKRAGSGNFAIGSDQGFLLNVEFTPDNFDVLMPVDEPLYHTNHYLSPLFRGQDTFKRDICDTFIRLNRLRRLGKLQKTPYTREDMWAVFKDHANYPDSICSHEDPCEPAGTRFCTMYAILMDLTEKKMWITTGNSCDSGIEEFTLE